MEWRDHIEAKLGVLGGKPVIKNTRISVELILEYFEEGGSIADVLDAYPHLTADQVRAALAFARELLVQDGSTARQLAA